MRARDLPSVRLATRAAQDNHTPPSSTREAGDDRNRGIDHVRASAFVSGAGLDDGGTPITPADIGFGITAKDVTGANVVTSRGLDAITGKFDYITNTFGSLTVTNGKTPFVAGTNGTLSDLNTSAQLMTGNRVSKLGNIQSDDNFMKLSFNVATLPQYFSPTTAFSAVITLTPVTF